MLYFLGTETFSCGVLDNSYTLLGGQMLVLFRADLQVVRFFSVCILDGRLSIFLFDTDLITSIHCLYHLHLQSALVSVAVYLP